MLNKMMPGMRPDRAPIGAPLQDLLVFAAGDKASINAMAYAEALTPDGNVSALMLCLLPSYPMNEFGGEAWLIARRDAEQAAAAAEIAFKQALAQQQSRIEVRRVDVMSGEEGRALTLQGQYADAVVFGWPRTDVGQPAREFEHVLFHSGRPVILVPETCVLRGTPQRIMVAWSATREATRAVNDALPLLQRATLVTVVVVADDGVRHEQNPGDDIARHLARHDVSVEVKHVPASGDLVHRVLLDEARFQGADMIVMGGYSHSRTGEWLFGGVTRDILGALMVPVMMSH